MKTGMVAILTLDEVVERVQSFLIGKIRDSAKDFLEGGPDFWMNTARGLTAKDDKGNYIREDDILQTWCNHCSENFFNAHDEVNEVLVDVSPKNGDGLILRKWLASC